MNKVSGAAAKGFACVGKCTGFLAVAASDTFGGPAGGRCDVSAAIAPALRSDSKSSLSNVRSAIIAPAGTSIQGAIA